MPSFDSQQELIYLTTQTSKQGHFLAIYDGVFPLPTSVAAEDRHLLTTAGILEQPSEKSEKLTGETMSDERRHGGIPVNLQTVSERMVPRSHEEFSLQGPVPNVNPYISLEENVKVGIDEAEMESIRLMLLRDHATLVIKGREYGPSWKQRGGVGAFMMMARKWDRIENQVKRLNYDVFQCVLDNPLESGILDDIGDLRRYLALIEDHVRKELRKAGKL